MKPIAGNISRASNSTSGIEVSVLAAGENSGGIASENPDIPRISEEVEAIERDDLDRDIHLETVSS